MTEKSYMWTTNGTGDGTGSGYTQTDAGNVMDIVASCLARNGIAPDYLNELAGSTIGANNARIASGGALVDGKPYRNDSNVDVTIPSAVGGGNTRIDRIVLRASWSAQTVRVTRIAGTDAASPTAPAITQTPGTTYDITLCQALVNTSGTVTITDERTWARVGADGIADGAITNAKLRNSQGSSVIGRSAGSSGVVADILSGDPERVLMSDPSNVLFFGQVSTAAIAAGAVTPIKIADRTRTFFVPAYFSDDAGGSPHATLGTTLPDGISSFSYVHFAVPQDFVSTMTVTPVVVPGASGNLRWSLTVNYGANNEAYNQHTGSVAATTTAVTLNQRKVLSAASLASAAIGDYAQIIFSRLGADALDTIGAAAYLVGFIVSYTADS